MARELGMNPKRARLLRLSLGLYSPPPRRRRPQGVLPWGRRRLFGRPEAHGRAEGAVHGALAVSWPVWTVLGLPRQRQPGWRVAWAECRGAEGGPLTYWGPPIGRASNLLLRAPDRGDSCPADGLKRLRPPTRLRAHRGRCLDPASAQVGEARPRLSGLTSLSSCRLVKSPVLPPRGVPMS
jgi:hypothetical protein